MPHDPTLPLRTEQARIIVVPEHLPSGRELFDVLPVHPLLTLELPGAHRLIALEVVAFDRAGTLVAPMMIHIHRVQPAARPGLLIALRQPLSPLHQTR